VQGSSATALQQMTSSSGGLLVAVVQREDSFGSSAPGSGDGRSYSGAGCSVLVAPPMSVLQPRDQGAAPRGSYRDARQLVAASSGVMVPRTGGAPHAVPGGVTRSVRGASAALSHGGVSISAARQPPPPLRPPKVPGPSGGPPPPPPPLPAAAYCNIRSSEAQRFDQSMTDFSDITWPSWRFRRTQFNRWGDDQLSSDSSDSSRRRGQQW
jgi:hypothetical protein